MTFSFKTVPYTVTTLDSLLILIYLTVVLKLDSRVLLSMEPRSGTIWMKILKVHEPCKTLKYRYKAPTKM